MVGPLDIVTPAINAGREWLASVREKRPRRAAAILFEAGALVVCMPALVAHLNALMLPRPVQPRRLAS